MFDYEEEQYFEPSLADEIVSEYIQKMKEVLLGSVKEDILSVKNENDALKKKNKILKDNQDKIYELERKVKYEKDNLKWTVRHERLSELMKDFNVVMYKVYNKTKKQPKCNKCNENRELFFMSPSGNQMKEQCKCDINIAYYIPKIYNCSEFRVDRDGQKMLMWYKENHERDYDYYSYESSNLAKVVYNDKMKYDDMDKYDTYFVNEKDCQKYCDWLNKEDK